MDFKKKWDEIHSRHWDNDLLIDRWLDGYSDIIKSGTKALDLGCGLGYDTAYLIDKGLDVVSADYSIVALKKVNEAIEKSVVIPLDMSEGLCFNDGVFDLVVADLSLHYFDSETTFKIMNEIKRVLKKGGHLIARVNSIYDINHGAGQGEMLEKNYYFVDGYNRRFFDDEDIIKFFSVIGTPIFKYADMLRYEKPKKVIEVIVRK